MYSVFSSFTLNFIALAGDVITVKDFFLSSSHLPVMFMSSANTGICMAV
jgi:hypothetical protein